MKKAISLVLIFILCMSLAGCAASKESLTKELTKHTWYREYEDYSDNNCLEVVEFHLDGTRVSRKYNLTHDGRWNSLGSADNLSKSWGITEDKELHFKECYYKWEKEWSLSGNKLVIGEVEYTNQPKNGYPS